MKGRTFLAAAICALFLSDHAWAADVTGTYVLKTEEATSVMTVAPVEGKYRIVIDAKTPLLNEEHTMHASLFEGEAPLRGDTIDITFRARGDDPSDMRDPEKSYSVEIQFVGERAMVKEVAGHRDAILNTPFGSVDIQGAYVKEAQSAL